jgi:tetratricopeptide (TPR) repeat protein
VKAPDSRRTAVRAIAARVAAIGLAASAVHAEVAGPGAVKRYVPATPNEVVLRVPARTANDPIAMLETRYSNERTEANAVELAQLYLQRARANREERYFARAEALVQPWAKRPEARSSTLRVQAGILQNRHEFAAAIGLLDRAISREPRDAGARLMRASVKLVQGQAEEARPDCTAVLSAGEAAAGTICLAQVLGATGELSRATSLVSRLLAPDGRVLEPASPSSVPLARPIRGWALWILADFTDRAGDRATAEQLLRAALEMVPDNEGVRSALADLLLARGATREAMELVDLPSPSLGLLARRAHAQTVLRDPAVADTRARIDTLLAPAARRGDRPHLREEALVALYVDKDAERALELARQNFEAQRETIDVRLLASAARASGNREALDQLSGWMRESRYEDRGFER